MPGATAPAACVVCAGSVGAAGCCGAALAPPFKHLSRTQGVGFGGKESEFWNSPLQIVGYDRIHEIGFRSNGVGYIPRRYCIARATMNDSQFRTVIYQIEDQLAFASFGDGVEWCVAGLDRNLAYAPGCSVLRPYVTRFLEGGERALSERY